MYNPHPFFISDVRTYIRDRLRPSLEVPTLLGTMTDEKYLCRVGHFCLQASTWEWPGQVGWKEDFSARVQAIGERLLSLQFPDGRWEWKEDTPDLSDAFPTAEAATFLWQAASLSRDPRLSQEAAQRGRTWLLTGTLGNTGPSNGHTGPPLEAALSIQNYNFLGSLLHCLSVVPAPSEPFPFLLPRTEKVLWEIFKGQDREGTWWWYGTDETGRTTTWMRYHELVVVGLTSCLSLAQEFFEATTSPLIAHLQATLSPAAAYMHRQQLPGGGLRLIPTSTEATPLGLWGALCIGDTFPEYTAFPLILLKHLLTTPPSFSREVRGVICRNLAEWMRRLP